MNQIGMIWYRRKKNFVEQEISSQSSSRIKGQLLTEFKKLLQNLPNDIKSKEAVDSINKQFSDSLDRMKNK